MGAGRKYDEAASKTQQNLDNYNSAIDSYKNLANKHTGEAGYKNSLKQATDASKMIAENAATGATQQAQTAARGSGLSKGAAAALGSQQAGNTYNNSYNTSFSDQQGKAYTAGTDKVNASSTAAGLHNQAVSNQAEIRNAALENSQNTWGNVGSVIGAAGALLTGSDERLKNYYCVSEKTKKPKESKIEKYKRITSKMEIK